MSVSAEVKVFDEVGLLSQAAAELIIEAGREAVKSRGRFLIALPGGGTPEPLFRLLASQDQRSRLPWGATHVLWGDERCVPADDPSSNYAQARRLLLDSVPVPANQVHRIKGEMTPEAAAADYRSLLAEMAEDGRAWPRLDLALMGLGSDGHTASLFPGPPTAGEDRLAAIATSGEYDGRPAERVSLTPAAFNSARTILFLVYGQAKALAVSAVTGGQADPQRWPGARIRPDSGRLIWFLDRAAAQLIDAHAP